MGKDVELSIEYANVSSLIPYTNNAKEHPQEQIEQIIASIRQFEMCDPIAVWTNESGELEIVEGHGRLLALESLGIEQAPIIRLDHLTDEERRAYTHVHNQLTMNTGFDEDILNIDIEELDFDWEEFGFDIDDEQEDEAEIDEAELKSEIEERCSDGDLWQLGEHRLLCGDSSDPRSFERVLDGQLADVVFTSPPYNGGAPHCRPGTWALA